MPDPIAKLRNRMTGEERTVDSPEELRSAYRELFADPGRNFRIYWSQGLRRLFGGRSADESVDKDSAA